MTQTGGYKAYPAYDFKDLNTQLKVPLMECTGRVRQRAGAWPNLLAWHSLPETRHYRQGRGVG